MQHWKSCLLALGAGILLACTAPAAELSAPPAAYTGPIFDVQLHAAAAAGNGPPPTATRFGISANLKYNPATPRGAQFGRLAAEPPCANPIWAQMTDQEVMDETIAAMRRLNVRGILSEGPEKVSGWMDAAPDLFIPSQMFNLAYSPDMPEILGEAFLGGEFAVLGEVTNQYMGFLADDARFDADWALAEELDIPVGTHLGVGPPGTPALTGGAYRPQSARPIESVLARHPRLRVYLMHAGYPYTAETKAMLYAYPQLYVDTAVLQMAAAREDYHTFLEDLVRGGLEDRIMFGSDQKKAILHGNAVRFFRWSN